MIQIILAILLGTLAGIFSGLIPGIHINLISIFTLTLISTYAFKPNITIIFLISMAITHTFLDFIPSIYLGAPTEDTFLSTLPGHSLLLKGQGHNAVKLTIIGGTIAILSLTIITPTFIYLIPKIYPLLQQMMGILLIWIVIFLISSESESKIKATVIFILSGLLSLATLNSGVQEPLLPLLTGLFATSTLIQSIQEKTILPKQIPSKLKLKKSEIIKPTLATIFISPICSLFPGLGSSQAAIISSQILRKTTREQFLILLGSINTLVMSTSFLTLILFQKSRTGTAFSISQITTLTLENLPIILTTIIFSTLISIPLALAISKTISKNIHKIPYTKISLSVLILLIMINAIISGLLGILILITATSLGLTCINFKIRRSFLMGSILIPTIIFYLPF